MAHSPLLKSYIFSGVCFCAHFTSRTFRINSSIDWEYTEHTFRCMKKKFFFYICSKSFPHLSRVRKSNNVTHFPRDLIHNIKSVSTCEFPIFLFLRDIFFVAKMVSWLRVILYTLLVAYTRWYKAIKHNLELC